MYNFRNEQEKKSMSNTLANAKRDFSIGYLTRFRIEKSPMADSWMLWLGDGNGAGWLIEARTKEPRVFKTLDSAVNTLESIGFQVLQLS